MSETTGGVPMFVCGPTTGCGKLTPMERIASGWITPRNCVHCGREWRRLPSQEITLTSDLLYAAPRREDAAGAGHHAPHARRYDLTVEDCLSCIEPKANGHYVDFDDYETLRRQYDATAEGYRAALSTAEREREPHPSEAWWLAANWKAPFTPGSHTGGNDGKVRDATGAVVADCFGWESRADVIADLLNRARVPSGGET